MPINVPVIATTPTLATPTSTRDSEQFAPSEGAPEKCRRHVRPRTATSLQKRNDRRERGESSPVIGSGAADMNSVVAGAGETATRTNAAAFPRFPVAAHAKVFATMKSNEDRPAPQ